MGERSFGDASKAVIDVTELRVAVVEIKPDDVLQVMNVRFTLRAVWPETGDAFQPITLNQFELDALLRIHICNLMTFHEPIELTD